MPKPLRSLFAVIAGFVVMATFVIVLTLIFVASLHVQSGHPTPLYLMLNIVYSAGAAIAGGWVAARVAGYRPIAHGVALALLMFLSSLAALRHPAPGQSIAYQVALAILMPLAAVAGSSLLRR